MKAPALVSWLPQYQVRRGPFGRALGLKHEQMRNGDNCHIRRLRFDGEANRLANFSILGSKPRVVIDMPDLSLRICPFLLEQRSELWRGELQDRIWCAGIKGIVLGVEGACPICGLRAISGSCARAD